MESINYFKRRWQFAHPQHLYRRLHWDVMEPRLSMEMMLFAAFAKNVERAADCNWDSVQDEAWKREVEKLHLISFCQVVRSWLRI